MRTLELGKWKAAMALIVAAAGVMTAADQNASKSNSHPETAGAIRPLANQNVNVVNTPTVNVASLPAVTLSGTPAVTISGTPAVNATVTFPANQAVNVTNTPTAPVPIQDVDYPARHAYQQSCQGNADPLGQSLCEIAPIPANSMFVIQTVSTSGSGTIPIGGVTIGISNGTSQAGLYLPVVQQTANYWAATQAVTLYAGPNAVPSCNSQSSPGGFVACTFIGYLVSLQ